MKNYNILKILKQKSGGSEKGIAPLILLVWGGIALAGAATAWWAGKSALATAVADFLAGLLIWVSYLFQYISRFLCFTAADVFDTSLTLFEKTITGNLDFIKGWTAVRDFSNMFIVLGFVIVGIATTLRIRDYEAKKLLLPLILVALLINFSGLFCGLIIDASNILAKSLISAAGIAGGAARGAISGMGMQFYAMAVKFVDTGLGSISEGTDKAGNLEFLKANIMLSFVFLAVAGTFFYMAILFTARYVVLAFLFILSPLAFFCKVFPFSRAQEIWKMWWENFLKWAFIGVGGTMSLWIASVFMKSVIAGGKLTVENLFIILLFLVIGFKITTKSSAMGAGAVMGIAGGAMGLAMGAVKTGGMGTLKGLGRGADAATGGRLSSAGQKISSTTGRAMEKIGLRAQGTTAQNALKGMDETSKRIGGMDEGDKTKVATGRTFTSRGMQEKVAAIQDKVKSGKISDLGSVAQQSQAIALAESYTKGRGGVSTLRKDALKLNPNIGNPTELRDAVQRQAPREFAKNIDHTAFTPAVLGAMDDKQMTTLANSGSKAKRDAVRDLVQTPAGKTQMQSHINDLLTQKKYSEVAEVSKKYKDAKKIFI